MNNLDKIWQHLRSLFSRGASSEAPDEPLASQAPRVCIRCKRLTSRQLSRCQQCDVYLDPNSVGVLAQAEPLQKTGYWPVGLVFAWVVLVYMASLGVSILDTSYLAPHHWWAPKPDVLVLLGTNHADLTLNAAEYWRMTTAIFLHQNLIHIGFNLCLLSFLGSLALKHLSGHRILLAVLLCGITGNIFAADAVFLGLTPFHNQGLGSALFGLAGLLAVMNRHSDPLQASRLKHLLIWGWMTFAGLSLLQIVPIDHFGHLGGLLAGIGLGYWYQSNIANTLGHQVERLALLGSGLLLVWGLHQIFLRITALLPG